MSAPRTRIPHIGLLYWAADPLEKTYCVDAFLPFQEAAKKGQLTFKYLTPVGGNAQRGRHPPLEKVKAARFDGVVTFGISKETYVGDLYKLGIPVVTLDHRSNGWPVDSVTFSARQSFGRIAQLFKDNGHTDILFISIFRPGGVEHGQGDTYIEDDTSLERRTALQVALAGSKVELWPTLPFRTGPGSKREVLVKAIKDLITNFGKAPTAITGHDTSIVDIGRQALEDLKLRVPQDVSLISVSAHNAETHPAMNFSMDTVMFTWREVGTESLRMLMERLLGKVSADQPPRHIELAGTYESAGTVADRRKKPPA